MARWEVGERKAGKKREGESGRMSKRGRRRVRW